MKTMFRNLFSLLLLLGLVSCADSLITAEAPEPVTSADSGSDVQEFIVNLPEIEEEAEAADTRTTFTFPEAGGFTTSWAKGDTLGIFPGSGGQVEFPISGTGSSASFNGGGWGLKTSSTYAAYYPYSKANYYQTSKTIVLDYTGQVQKGNNSHAHLGGYDFLASKNPVTPSGGSVTIEMDRLNALLMLQLTVTVGGTYTELELYSDGTPFVTKAELDISQSVPKLTPVETSKVIRLKLDDVTLNSGELLTVYMMAYPIGQVNPKVVLHGYLRDYQGALNKTMNLSANMKYTRQATMNQGRLITNKKLISCLSSEIAEGLLIFDDNGYIDVNLSTNRELLSDISRLYLNDKNDPTICDEIGYFTNLQELYCDGNFLTSLDLSKNLKLYKLSCKDNSLTYLNLSNNKALVELDCSINPQLKYLDVSENRALRILNCTWNGLKTIDLSENSNLYNLNCSNNSLSSLDLKQDVKLLDCGNNKLSSLDISNCSSLRSLKCNNNFLRSIDTSHAELLEYLDCSYNDILLLSLTNNVQLEELYCEYNQLTYLMPTKCENLRKLYCHHNQINNLALAKNYYLQELDCSYNQLSEWGMTSQQLCIAPLLNPLLEQLNIGGNLFTELSIPLYLQGFGNMKMLYVSDSQYLTSLSCPGIGDYSGSYDNPLVGLYVDNCPLLESLDCKFNTSLQYLHFSDCPSLTSLNCSYCGLSSLNVSSNSSLTSLVCWGNYLANLDITSCSSLAIKDVYCGSQFNSDRDWSNRKDMTLKVTSAQNTSSSLNLTTACFSGHSEKCNDKVNVTR